MKRFLVIIVGVIFILAGALLFFKNNNLVKNCTVETQATVVDMKEELSSDTDSSSFIYYPIIEYNINDETVRVVMDNGSNPPKYSLNSKITILYNPNNHKQFIVKGEKTSNIFSILFMGLGVIITGYGIKVAIKKEG